MGGSARKVESLISFFGANPSKEGSLRWVIVPRFARARGLRGDRIRGCPRHPGSRPSIRDVRPADLGWANVCGYAAPSVGVGGPKVSGYPLACPRPGHKTPSARPNFPTSARCEGSIALPPRWLQQRPSGNRTAPNGDGAALTWRRSRPRTCEGRSAAAGLRPPR